MSDIKKRVKYNMQFSAYRDEYVQVQILES